MKSADVANFIDRSPRKEMVAVRRQTAVSPQTWVNAVVPACVRQYSAADLVGGILQGDFEVIVAHSALAEAGFPVPPKDGDRVVRNPTIVDGEFVPGGGVTLTVKHPGDRGGAIGYWMQARGGGVG